MSGLAGFWNLDGAPADRQVLARMSATLRHRAPDGEDVLVDGPMALAHQHLWVTSEENGERQPLTARDVHLAMDGRIDNRDELVAHLGLAASSSDATLVLDAYARWGDSFAEHLNGEFAVVVADAARRTILIARDAIGVRPLYYVHTARLFAFASEVKALLAHPDITVRPDDEGLADYLLIDSRPLDSQQVTCFAGIFAVVPAHLVIVTPERLTSRRYWEFDTGRVLRLGSFEEYSEALGERFAEAVKRRVRGPRPVAVSVSGGLDSSSIFCQAETLRRAGSVQTPAVAGISYTGDAGSDADEREYLAIIEREYGVAIDRFPMEPLIGFARGADDQVSAVESPFVDYMWWITRELHRRAAATGARVLLSGHWGDQVLFSMSYIVDLFNRGAWTTIRRHTREYGRWFGVGEARVMTRRLPTDIARQHLPRAIVPPLTWVRRRLLGMHRQKPYFSDRFLRRALRDADRPATIGSGFHSAHARSIYLEARSKYNVMCMEWNNKIGALHGLDFVFPFLDRDLLGFLMAVPGEIQNQGGVPRAMMREAMRGILPEPLRARRWKANFSDVVNRGVAQDARMIIGALGPQSIAVRCGYIDAARLQPELDRMIPQLAGSDCYSAWDLADLYALERWLRLFFGQL